MGRDLGTDKMYMLEFYADKFRNMFFDIYKQLFEAGFFTAEQFYKQIEPNKDNYATFAVAEYFLETNGYQLG